MSNTNLPLTSLSKVFVKQKISVNPLRQRVKLPYGTKSISNAFEKISDGSDIGMTIEQSNEQLNEAV
jgi:hypothetical protein